jgi:Flp pilus assembly protein TadB
MAAVMGFRAARPSQKRLGDPSSRLTTRRDRQRLVIATIFAAILIIGGCVTLYRGSLGWTNYWGGLVFAPFAIVVGLLVFVAVFKKPAQRRRGRNQSRFP